MSFALKYGWIAMILLATMIVVGLTDSEPAPETPYRFITVQSAEWAELDLLTRSPGATSNNPYGITDFVIDTVIHIESSGNPNAVGKKGERGLMQIMPATWTETCQRILGRTLPYGRAFEPELNVRIGTGYLEYLSERLREKEEEWNSPYLLLLFAAYNAGPSAVERANYNLDALPRPVQEYAMRGARGIRKAVIGSEADH